MAAKKKLQKPSKTTPQSNDRLDGSTPTKPLVFISHDSRDADLAEAFSKLLSGISAGILKSFRSSDKKSNQGIEFGVEWYPEVMTQIDSATDVVCLLTPNSLERPWILYEAGVAKGKMNIPVFGVALGIPLAKASTGPFAQFQNCGEDSDSLTKLVTQLMCRIPGAEPDKGTVEMQVAAFKVRATELKKSAVVPGPEEKSQSEPDESVAKLFEEVKVMFRDLPSRLERRMEPPGRRKRRLHPEMIFHLGHRLGDSKNNEVGFLIMLSMLKEDLPWLYEMGLDVYHNLNSGAAGSRLEASVKRLRRACDLAAHEPMFRELIRDEESMFAVMELRGYLEHWLGFQSEIGPRKKTGAAPAS